MEGRAPNLACAALAAIVKIAVLCGTRLLRHQSWHRGNRLRLRNCHRHRRHPRRRQGSQRITSRAAHRLLRTLCLKLASRGVSAATHPLTRSACAASAGVVAFARRLRHLPPCRRCHRPRCSSSGVSRKCRSPSRAQSSTMMRCVVAREWLDTVGWVRRGGEVLYRPF